MGHIRFEGIRFGPRLLVRLGFEDQHVGCIINRSEIKWGPAAFTYHYSIDLYG